ncbi:MAG: RNA methyltransferase [Alphaproteobacteria bacterium]|nr:RNA methyltransferase [Alphaproteobacteria bacterium]
MAGTDRRNEFEFKRAPAVILCEPQLGENIGMVARAMSNFGLWDLRIVNPRDGWPSEKAVATAARAKVVIEGAKIFESAEAAVADLHVVFATTARPRDMFIPVIGPDEAAGQARAEISKGNGVGFLFGRERWGLNNDEVALATAIVTLPIEPAFASLNIAQAVLVIAYEWRRAAPDGPLPFAGPDAPAATGGQVNALSEHLVKALDGSGFFVSPDKRCSMVLAIKTMIHGAGFNAQQVRTLRGAIASLAGHHRRDEDLK